MTVIKLLPLVGTFAENKDIARDIRVSKLKPEIEQGNSVDLDFDGIEGVTQPFIHALISDLLRVYGPKVLDQISFSNCNDVVKKIITMVTDYMQATF